VSRLHNYSHEGGGGAENTEERGREKERNGKLVDINYSSKSILLAEGTKPIPGTRQDQDSYYQINKAKWKDQI